MVHDYMRKAGHQDESYTGTFVAYSFPTTDAHTKCVQFDSSNDEHLVSAFPNLFKHQGVMAVCPDRGYDVQVADPTDMKWGSWFTK